MGRPLKRARIPFPWMGRVCAFLQPSPRIPQDIRGNFSCKCGVLSAPRLHESPQPSARHVQCTRFSEFTLGIWKVNRFVRKLAENISPGGKGPCQAPEDSPKVVQADIRRWVPTLGCNKASKEIQDPVVYELSHSCYTGPGFQPGTKLTMQKRREATRWQQKVRKVSCRWLWSVRFTVPPFCFTSLMRYMKKMSPSHARHRCHGIWRDAAQQYFSGY